MMKEVQKMADGTSRYECTYHYLQDSGMVVPNGDENSQAIVREMHCRATSLFYGAGVALGSLLGYDVDHKEGKVVDCGSLNKQLKTEEEMASMDFKLEAERLYLEDNMRGALDHVSWAMSLDPEGEWLHFDRGRYYARGGDYEKAVYDFTYEISNSPCNALAQDRSYYERGMVFDAMGKSDEALLDFKQAVKSDHGFLSGLAVKAVVGQISKARNQKNNNPESSVQRPMASKADVREGGRG